MDKNLSSLLSEQVALLVEYKFDWEKRGNLSTGWTGRSYVATTPVDFFKAQQRQEGFHMIQQQSLTDMHERS